LQKLKEVFVPQPVMRKNLSRIFKIFVCSKIDLEEDVVKQEKMVNFLGKWFFFGGRYSGPTPPPSLNVERPGGSGIQYRPLI
jgi:hypothetical protein